jgi:hypothetical protein
MLGWKNSGAEPDPFAAEGRCRGVPDILGAPAPMRYAREGRIAKPIMRLEERERIGPRGESRRSPRRECARDLDYSTQIPHGARRGSCRKIPVAEVGVPGTVPDHRPCPDRLYCSDVYSRSRTSPAPTSAPYAYARMGRANGTPGRRDGSKVADLRNPAQGRRITV